jgi:enoyl-CoA hydratase/carnithine racemase
MTTGIVHIERHDGGVAELRLDRPPVNALNAAFLAEFHRAVDELAVDSGVRAVVLTGAGKTLSGGMDLKELQAFTDDDQRAMVTGLNATYAAIYGLPKPVVCAAHGAAIAGGLFFVLASDYRIAGERAQFGLAEVRVGVRFPVGPFAIARHELSADACRRFMLGGRNHDAATALALGVVDEVVPTAQVLSRALEVAAEYGAVPPRTFAETKHQLRAEVPLPRPSTSCARRCWSGWRWRWTARPTRCCRAGSPTRPATPPARCWNPCAAERGADAT